MSIESINEYQRMALKTANPELLFDEEKGLCDVALGLCGESGEIADLIKKHLYQGHELDKEHLKRELGDVAWYVALGACLLGTTLEDLLTMNIVKLHERYPNGFDPKRSQNRDKEDR